jgi:hypothetical protein
LKIAARQDAGEKSLHEVLCVVLAVALAPDVNEQGVPIRATERFERTAGADRIRLVARREHDTPVRGFKRAPAAAAGA